MKLWIGLLAGLALVVSLTATAATAVKDPSRMILRKADIGASGYEVGDDLDSYLRRPLQAAGLSGRVATYYATSFTNAKGFVTVSGIVLTVVSAPEARRVFAITTQARDRFPGRAPRDWKPLRLRSYGEQQRALVNPPGEEGIAIAELIVRKNTSVWLLYVVLERRPKPPVDEVVADLERLASKQKQRVGAG